MRDMDIIHTGFGGCKVPFAFFELWANPEGKGAHSDYTFDTIRLEDSYSLFQVRQDLPKVSDVHFSDVWTMDGPQMVPPVLNGAVSGVTMQQASPQGYEGSTVELEDGAGPAQELDSSLTASFRYSSGVLQPGEPIRFETTTQAIAGRRFIWLFGDGTRDEGQSVEHRFPDAQGTLLDGSGRFRVLLHVVDANGRQSWSSQSVVVARRALAALPVREVKNAGPHGYDGMFAVPADGGYTFTLLTSTKGSLTIDDLPPAVTPQPRHQVCGAQGDAVQPVRVSAVLRAGLHHIRVERDDAIENAATDERGNPVLLWEGPALGRQRMPPPPVVLNQGNVPRPAARRGYWSSFQSGGIGAERFTK
jgi:hypothetical protein